MLISIGSARSFDIHSRVPSGLEGWHKYLHSRGQLALPHPEPLCQCYIVPWTRKSASVPLPGASCSPPPARWLPARLCCLITLAQTANDFVLSSLMSWRRIVQVCLLAARTLQAASCKRKEALSTPVVQKKKKGGGRFPKISLLGAARAQWASVGHHLGSASISCSLTHPLALCCLISPLPYLRYEYAVWHRGKH